MNTTQIIEAAEQLSEQEQKSIARYFILKFINPNKKEFPELLSFSNTNENESDNKPLKNFVKSKGILKDIDLSDISEEEVYLQEN